MSAIKESEIGNYFGRKIAIDASMAIYQVRAAWCPFGITLGVDMRMGRTVYDCDSDVGRIGFGPADE